MCFSDSVAYFREFYPPVGLPCLTLKYGLLSGFIISCFVLFRGCLLEACSFLKGNGKGVRTPGARGKVESLEVSKEGKLWSGCIV